MDVLPTYPSLSLTYYTNSVTTKANKENFIILVCVVPRCEVAGPAHCFIVLAHISCFVMLYIGFGEHTPANPANTTRDRIMFAYRVCLPNSTLNPHSKNLFS